MQAQAAHALSMAMRVKADYKILKFVQRGNQVYATIRTRAEMLAKNPRTKQVYKAVHETTGEETWQNVNGKWLCKKSRALKENVQAERQPNSR
jgi:hypothetical protein